MRVAAFLVRRTAAGVFTLLALLLVTFAVYWALPSTPSQIIYPGRIHLTDYQIEHGRHLFGLDRPKTTQYADYVWHLLHGDFGKAWQGSQLTPGDRLQQQSLNPIVLPAVRVTLSLILGGAVLVVLIAVPLGAFTGTRIGTLSDRAVMAITLLGICTHPMVLGNVLDQIFGYRGLRWDLNYGYCPLIRGGHDPCGGPVAWAGHLLMPWITFALLYLALYTRMVRASVSDTLHEEFVRTARAKGASELRVVGRHVLPNAALRVLTMVGMEIGTAIGLSIYVEYVFGLHGIASYAITAMGGASADIDLPFTLAVVTLVTLVVVIGNLIVDGLATLVDPRVGWEGRRGRSKGLVGGVF